MRDEKRHSREEDSLSIPKRRRSEDDQISYLVDPRSSSASKVRSHIPMSERQQFALLRQMEVSDHTHTDKDRISPASGGVKHSKDWSISGSSQSHKDGECDPASHQSGRYYDPGHVFGSPRDQSSSNVLQMDGGRLTSANSLPKLFTLAKTGDVEGLKLLVKDGIDVNEQDDLGRTALHEFSSRNLPRQVAYLLRHGAQPNLAALNGDTALHEAARSSHARVIRSLLRHDADPLVLNSQGERPFDLFQDGEVMNVFNQHMELTRAHGNSSVSTKSNQSSSKSHHRHPSHLSSTHVTERSRIQSTVASSTTSSDPHLVQGQTMTVDICSDSDETCSTPRPTSGSSSLSLMTADQMNAFTTTAPPAISPSLLHSKTSHNDTQQSKPVKKDPYAFEDEADECLEPGSSLHHPIGSSSTKLSNNSPTTTATVVNRGRGSDGGSIQVSTTGHDNSFLTTPSITTFSVDPLHSHISPSAGLNNNNPLAGPPLRLRFAKEAGHYTLMEQQQQQQLQFSQQPTIQVEPLTPTNSASAVCGENTFDESLASQQHQLVDPVRAPSAEIGEIDNQASELHHSPRISTQTLPSMDYDWYGEDGAHAQKVPPLRIKFASGTPTETDSFTPPTVGNELAAPVGADKDHNPTAPYLEAEYFMARHGEKRHSDDYRMKLDNDPFAVVEQSSDEILPQPPIIDSRLEQHVACTNSAIVVPNQQVKMEETMDECENKISPLASDGDGGDFGIVSRPSLGTCDVEDGNKENFKDNHRRSGRTLRSHTAAAQREKEEKERHVGTTPIKKRKLRTQRIDTSMDGSAPLVCPTENVGGGLCASNTPNICTMEQMDPITTATSDSLSSDATEHVVNNTETSHNPISTTDDPCLSMNSLDSSCVGASTTTSCDLNTKPFPSGKFANFLLPTTMVLDCSTVPLPLEEQTKSDSCSTTCGGGSAVGDEDPQTFYLTCPVGPDEDKRNMQLYMYENPYEKAERMEKRSRELINNLVEVHPKAPSGYDQYLLVSRNYLLANGTPSLCKRQPPTQLEPDFVDLFNEQEDERYSQALKHQSEREHLRLCAEQARLRAQTRASLANMSKPLSFCSVLAIYKLKDLPPTTKPEDGHEEHVDDRFTQHTFISMLESIHESFQKEKHELLCRQLHEAESLMMVQRLDWESKMKELNLHDYSREVVCCVPPNHVPMIHVPNDFPLIPLEPVPFS